MESELRESLPSSQTIFLCEEVKEEVGIAQFFDNLTNLSTLCQ